MIKTKSLDEPIEKDDGFRLCITRYRRRNTPKGKETWDYWEKKLGPSEELHAAWYGRRREGRRVVERGLPPISWKEYVKRFRVEMKSPEAKALMQEVAKRSARGEVITLLCFCENEKQCHRSLVKEMIEREERRLRDRSSAKDIK